MHTPQDESSTSRQALPNEVIAWIFRELQGNYGSRFLNQWKTGQTTPGGSDAGVQNAMRTWARKLVGFSDQTHAIESVLEHLPNDPPSLPEFVALCRTAASRPRDSAPKLQHVMTPEERATAERATNAAMKALNRDKRDHKAWAKRLQKREEAGEKLTVIQRNAWREALGVIDDEQQQEAA